MFDFTEDIRNVKEQRLNQEKNQIALLDDVLRGFILSEDGAAIILTTKKVDIVPYKCLHNLRINAKHECSINHQSFSIEGSISEEALKKYYYAFSMNYGTDFTTFVMDTQYVIMKNF